MKTYSELITIDSYLDRLRYLQLGQIPTEPTFDQYRYVNQNFYKSTIWRHIRDLVIVRDNGWDMAHPNTSIVGPIYVHHINPITLRDIDDNTSVVTDMDNLVCVSFDTHQAIHFLKKTPFNTEWYERRPGDTTLW